MKVCRGSWINVVTTAFGHVHYEWIAALIVSARYMQLHATPLWVPEEARRTDKPHQPVNP